MSKIFWDNIVQNVQHYLIDGLDQDNPESNDDEKLDQVFEFQAKFNMRALNDKKEWLSIELILKSFFCSNMSLPDYANEYHYDSFLPLFEKIAELSSKGKISIKWILELNHIKEVRAEDVHSDYGSNFIWKTHNQEYIQSLKPFVAMYQNVHHLFTCDLEDDQKDIEDELHSFPYFKGTYAHAAHLYQQELNEDFTQ
uniref:Uncharacterized protein n=1 Tax=Pithovirus LCPAC403 TaxID=2506596 RepID=A0A481ZBA5_9VIRU|nr:MAG: uncharacterized protein LCPAC403_00600 [Pithovirus LCPAC403]